MKLCNIPVALPIMPPTEVALGLWQLGIHSRNIDDTSNSRLISALRHLVYSKNERTFHLRQPKKMNKVLLRRRLSKKSDQRGKIGREVVQEVIPLTVVYAAVLELLL